MKLTVRSSTISEGEWDQFILAESPWAFFQSFAWGETQLLEKVAVARWEFLLDDDGDETFNPPFSVPRERNFEVGERS